MFTPYRIPLRSPIERRALYERSEGGEEERAHPMREALPLLFPFVDGENYAVKFRLGDDAVRSTLPFVFAHTCPRQMPIRGAPATTINA